MRSKSKFHPMGNIYKNILTILCGILIYTSCNNVNQHVEKQLLNAQQLMDTQPDSAFIVLNQHIDHQKLTTKQYALWCLLLTKAKDKNYMTHASDSLINIAMVHYEKTGEKDLLMESYYYMGRVNHDLKNSLKAQDYYLKALETGEGSEDYKFLMRICYNIGSLYLYQNVSEQALEYFKKTLKYAECDKDSTSQSYSLRDIARCFSIQNNQDSALVYYAEALKYTNDANKIYILNELGSTYQKTGKYQEALLYLKEALNIIPENRLEKFRHIHLNIGLTHFATNHFDSAAIYLEEAAKSNYMPTKAGAQGYLHKLAKLNGDTEKALFYIEYAKLLNDSIYEENQSNSLRKTQTLYDYSQSENAINKLKIARISSERGRYRAWTITFFVIVIASFSIALLVYLFKLFKKENTRLEKEFIDFKQYSDTVIKNNITKITELEAIIKESSYEIKRIEKENEALKVEQEKREKSAETLKNSTIYKKYYWAIQKIEDSKLNKHINIEITSEDKEVLKQFIENLYPDFAFTIMQHYSSISKDEFYLCCLCKIGITSPSVLCHFMYITPHAVTMKRDRLYFKLFKKKGNKKSFERFIDLL